MVRTKDTLVFNTAIITYPSDYDGLLTLGTIVDNFERLGTKDIKIVVAREDPDEEIKRIHHHVYYDSKKRKQVKPKYFDIPLREPVYVFIKDDTTREYRLKSELDSNLGIDNTTEMPAKLDQYLKMYNEDKNNTHKYIKWDLLSVAHPNLQLKKEYGDKYFMLKYVMKQKLVARSNFDIEEELKYLEQHKEELEDKARDLETQELLKELNLHSVQELIELCKKYVKKLKNQQRSKKQKKSNNNLNDDEFEFIEKIREFVTTNQGITKQEVWEMIKQNPKYFRIFSMKYLNYRQYINDLFKNNLTAKPTVDYTNKFYLPKKLWHYCMWLNLWVEKWMTHDTEWLKKNKRPKGLCLIGDSRTCKTSLMTVFGPFVYIKNIWNSDNWEALPPYIIMDDMDAADEGKGLNFSWFKPFFGAQETVTITDKYRPKKDIVNGKPLIWINNFKLDETFKSESAMNYIRKNMEIIDIGDTSLAEPHEDWIEGHNDYIEFDPKSTWYYKHVVNPQKKINWYCPKCGALDYPTEEDLENGFECYFCKNEREGKPSFCDQGLVEYYHGNNEESDDEEELQPLSERKRKLKEKDEFEIEKGRPIRRVRTEDSSE